MDPREFTGISWYIGISSIRNALSIIATHSISSMICLIVYTPLKWSSLDTGICQWKSYHLAKMDNVLLLCDALSIPVGISSQSSIPVKMINNQFPTHNPATNHKFHWKSMNIHWSIILMVSSSFKHIQTYLFPVKTAQGVAAFRISTTEKNTPSPRLRSRSSWRCGWNNRSPGEKKCLDQWTLRHAKKATRNFETSRTGKKRHEDQRTWDWDLVWINMI